MSPPELLGDLAAVFLARTWHRQPEGAPPMTDRSTWPDQPTIGADAAAALKPGDPLRVFLDSGEEHQLVVTSAPQVDADGTVRFEAADPVRVAAMERITGLGARFEEASRQDAAKWQAVTRHADAAEAAGRDITFEFAPDQPTDADTAVEQLEVHHARGRERTDNEAAVLEPKYATGGVVTAPALGVNEPRSDAEVLRIAAAQADARRARAEHAAPDVRPLSVTELMRERLGAQVTRRAERLGQLNVGGAA